MFYENLYNKKYNSTPLEVKNADNIFLNQDPPTLNELERDSCEGEISESECLKVLKEIKNGKF